MRVLLMRHGIAVDSMDPHCPADHERPLTAKGERRTRAAAEGLVALGEGPERILSSPLVRARQTAEILAEVMDEVPIDVVSALSGGVRTRDLFDVLAELDREAVCCVGHAPQLDLFLAQALPHDQSGPGRLKKAGAACLEFDIVAPSGAQLVWFMAPRALRRLGRAEV